MKKKEEFRGFSEHEYRPILRDESIQHLENLIKKHRPKRILEIGTFIGYSASVMLEADKDCFVCTIEKDKNNARDAIKNLNEQGFAGRFDVVCADAFEFLVSHQEEKYDFIFLDGPKGQYIKYLPYLKKVMNKGAILLADDILFYGMVRSTEKIDHKHRALVNNLRKFITAVENDPELETKIYDFANGMSESRNIK